MTLLAFVTNAVDGTVSTFALDGAGLVSRLAVSAVGAGCSTLAVDPGRRMVHVAVKGDVAAIVSCRVGADGSLHPVARREVDAALQYLALTRTVRHCSPPLTSAVSVSRLPVDDSGIGEVSFSRSTSPTCTPAPISADGRNAYFVSLGADLIVQCSLDGSRLTPAGSAEHSRPGGLRPAAHRPDRRRPHAYVMTEYSGEVLHYRRTADGVLTSAAAGGGVRSRPRVAAQSVRGRPDGGAPHLGRRPAPVIG